MNGMTRRTFLKGSLSLLPGLYPERYLDRFSVALRRYRVPVAGLPPSFEGFTILHLSDLHEKEFGIDSEGILKLLRGERFDLVALTGDLVVGNHPIITPALNLVAAIRTIAEPPFYSVSGNHDWRLERAPELNRRLTEAGVNVIGNRAVELWRGSDRIWVVGIDDPVTGRDRLPVALEGVDNKEPRILLSHSPHPYPQALREGIDLMLCGHTHGGQIRLPVVGALYVPTMGLFPRWDYGMYRNGKSTLIVSGGLGESGVPIRFNIEPELALVTLERSPGAHAVSPG